MPSDERAVEIIKLRDELEKNKGSFLPHWEDLARIMLPRRAGFTQAVIPGESRTEEIFDGTPMQSARSLGHHMGFWLRPESSEWYFIKADDDFLNGVESVDIWLDNAKQTLDQALTNPKARFRQSTGEMDLDLVVFGTGIMFIGEGKNLNHLIFQSLHLKDSVLVYDEDGNIEGVIHTRKWTVRQAINRWGRKMSQNVQDLHKKGKLDEKVDIAHAVMPRKDKKFDNPRLGINMPVADFWIESEEKSILEEGGFHEFPFVAPRWDTTSGEDYGRSPGMIALPDSATLQAMGETILVSGQRAADPPLLAPNDGAINEMNTFPGAISYYDVDIARELGGNPVFPLQSGVNLPITRDMQTDSRDQVMRAFFRNVLNLPIDGPQMTATEVMQRKEEFIREIGPVFGRFETDYTAPMIQRSFNIMLRAGAFGEIPPELQGANIRFEFESPVNKVKQQIKASAAKLWVAEQLQLAQVMPEALDHINVDGLAHVTHEAGGVPNEVRNPKELIEAKRKQRQKSIEQAQQMDRLERGANVAETFANTADKAGMTEQLKQRVATQQ
jgi:hypothetical protein|tara:strand:+ start:1176 stop:2843 length:1668 start_codon:yes stop_codon:yes gene_type:complete